MDTPDEKDVATKLKRQGWDFQDEEDTRVTQHSRQLRNPLWECPAQMQVTNLEPTVRQPSKNRKPHVQRLNQKHHPLAPPGIHSVAQRRHVAYDGRTLVEAYLLNRGPNRRATLVVLINDKVQHEVACHRSLQQRHKVIVRGRTSAQAQETTPTGVNLIYNVFCACCAWAQKYSAA